MKTILSIFFLALSFTVFAQNMSGGMGNGGHPVEIEFQVMGREVVQELTQLAGANPGLAEINVYDLAFDIEVTGIEIKSEVIRGMGGKEVCAASYPGAKLIQLNLKCWKQLMKNERVARAFVLKTYLDLDQVVAAKSSRLASLFFQALKKQ